MSGAGYNYILGIDSGSTVCKAALLRGGEVLGTYATKTGWNPAQSAQECVDALLGEHGLSRGDVSLAATGYGREAVQGADCTITEITCHAHGGMLLCPEAQGIVDIGGQDSKVIQLQNKKVYTFFMNDKCAAGTGRFLSMACDTMDIPVEQIDSFCNLAQPIAINSMCTVFAESEIIGLLSMQRDRAGILAGVLYSIAQKVQQMTGKINFAPGEPVLMTGGLSRSAALLAAVAETTGLNLQTHPLAPFAGAIGACVCAAARMG